MPLGGTAVPRKRARWRRRSNSAVSILSDAAKRLALGLDELFGILLVRRSDGALAFVEVPEEARRNLRMFGRNAVVRSGVTLQEAVRWALPDADFQVDDEIGTPPLWDGATPAGLGSIRLFQATAFGIDIGEFELPVRTGAVRIDRAAPRAQAGAATARLREMRKGPDPGRIRPLSGQ